MHHRRQLGGAQGPRDVVHDGQGPRGLAGPHQGRELGVAVGHVFTGATQEAGEVAHGLDEGERGGRSGAGVQNRLPVDWRGERKRRQSWHRDDKQLPLVKQQQHNPITCIQKLYNTDYIYAYRYIKM